METIKTIDIEEATKRYSDALNEHTLLKRKAIKNEIELKRTHNEVVLAWQDLSALRYQN